MEGEIKEKNLIIDEMERVYSAQKRFRQKHSSIRMIEDMELEMKVKESELIQKKYG